MTIKVTRQPRQGGGYVQELEVQEHLWEPYAHGRDIVFWSSGERASQFEVTVGQGDWERMIYMWIKRDPLNAMRAIGGAMKAHAKEELLREHQQADAA